MGRPRKYLVVKAHPTPRVRDQVRLIQHIRGPDDDSWNAQFLIDGEWQPHKPFSLSTRDWHEACVEALVKYGAVIGQGISAVIRKPPYAPRIEHRFGEYAERAIRKLEQQAEVADTSASGKGHNFRQIAGRIRRDLMPRWSETDITQLTDSSLNHWAEFEYRVEDRAATVKLYGRQPRDATRQKVLVKPSANTLGNLDQALLYVWTQAVADQIVDRRARPMLDRSLGEEAESRAFIDADGVMAVAHIMSDAWIAADNGHGADLKRLARAYFAMIGATGIRPGLEAKRLRVCDVLFRHQDDKPVIVITVLPRQGKHPRPRDVVVFEGGMEFNVRRLLHELVDLRIAQGAGKRDPLFAYPDGREPMFRDVLNNVLREANAVIDPLTNEKRTEYSFRHFFATRLIERGLSVPFIAAWMGTSSQMIEKYYNRFIIARQAAAINGANPWISQMTEVGRSKVLRLVGDEDYGSG
jgi:integrase